MIFRGTFEHALDAKNRLTVPAKYRDALRREWCSAFSPETEVGTTRSLSIWRPDDYDSFVAAGACRTSTRSGPGPAT